MARNDRLGSMGLAGLILETSPCAWGLWRPLGVVLCLLNIIYSFAILPSSRRRSLLSQADDPCPRPAEQGDSSSLCVSACVLLQRRSLSWVTGDVQCQVIAPCRLLLLSTTLLQPHSFYRQLLLLQNPFSSPVPQQVLVFTGNECIKGGVGRLEPTGRSHKFEYEVSSALLPGWRLSSLWCPSVPPHPVPLLRGPAGAPAWFGICRVLLCHGA